MATVDIETYVSVLKDILGLVSLSESQAGTIPVNSLLLLTKEEATQVLAFSSVTFGDQDLVNGLYANYDQSEIPEWDTPDSMLRILQVYWKRCEIREEDLKPRLRAEFPDQSDNHRRYQSIKAMVTKGKGNHGIKRVIHDYLATGTQTGDFLYYKNNNLKKMHTDFKAYQEKRTAFQNLADEENATIANVNQCFEEIEPLKQNAYNSIDKFLRTRMKNIQSLTPKVILSMWNLEETMAERNGLCDLMEEKEAIEEQLYYMHTVLHVREYFEDLQEMSRNDKKLRDDFVTRQGGQQTNGVPPTGDPTQNLNQRRDEERHGNGNTLRRQPSTTAQENYANVKNHIETQAYEDLIETDKLLNSFPVKPDKAYEGKILSALDSLKSLQNDTLREERKQNATFILYHDINDKTRGGEILRKILQERVGLLQETKLSLSELDKRYSKKKEERIKLIETYKIKKISSPKHFITW